MPIQILSDVVAAQIAAGEVIERPASVVKELVENALDAGAAAIEVEVEQGGKRLMRISDDGTGIPAAEAEQAFLRHATSKLRTIDDLTRITTLGFRGEALASISAVSRTTMTTRHVEEPTGTTVQVEGGEVRYARPAGAPAGTVFAVENLFFNTPARLKFMKSESTERRHITQVVTHYAMAYPHVRFRLVQEGREQLRSTGSGDLADVLVESFGLDTFKSMLEVSPQPVARPDLPPIEVAGFTSAPELTRANRGQITLFVNGRVIADQNLTYAVVQAYHNLLPPGRYPVAVLMLTLAPEEVDVNVHPTKAEVRFRVPEAVFGAVRRALQAALGDQPAYVTTGWGGPSSAGEFQRPVVPGEEQLQMALETLDPGQRRVPAELALPAATGAPPRPRTLPILRVVGQVGAMYIVTEGPAGLYLLDQHAAHCRVIYDQLREQLDAGQPVEQVTLDGPPIDLPGAAARWLVAALETPHFAALGFDIEPFGGSTFRLRAMPTLLANEDPVALLHTIATALSEQSDGEPLAEQLIRLLSVLAAYKAGQVLEYDDMEGLVRCLERCVNPHEDPDSNPTLLHISGDDLARHFGTRRTP